jgi:hypothetical protein
MNYVRSPFLYFIFECYSFFIKSMKDDIVSDCELMKQLKFNKNKLTNELRI